MGSVIVDMSHRIEVERPGGAKGVWIIRPLSYREFLSLAKDHQAPASGVVSSLELFMKVCVLAVVGYRIEGKEHPVTQEMLEAASAADIAHCYREVTTISKLDVETAGN